MTPSTRATILAALSEAADAKRDRIGVCPDCHDGTCGSCEYRAQAAAEYDTVAGIAGETYDREPGADDVSEWRAGYEAGCDDTEASCLPRSAAAPADREAGG